MRETSIEAYNTIKENGMLSDRRWEVYDTLFFSEGVLSHSEVCRIIISRHPLPPGMRHNVPARLNELREMGCVYEVKTKTCPITGMNVIAWDVTTKLPKKITKPKVIKCKACNGTGVIAYQERFDI